jgi:maltose O-acetyltransferase
MTFYYTSKLCKSIKVSRAATLINSRPLSKKKRNILLKKSGVSFEGESIITPPFFYEFGKIKLGCNVYINSGCTFLDNANITIGAHSLIGPNVTLTTVSHPVAPKSRHAEVITSSIEIGSNVWLGAGVVVLPGVSLETTALSLQTALLNSNIPDNSLFAGAPAIFKRNL